MKKNLTLTASCFLVLALFTMNSCVKTATLSYIEPLHQVCLTNPLDSAHEESSLTEITAATVRQVFAAQNVTFDPTKINTVKLSSLKVTAKNGTNFDNIESIRLLVKLVGANSDIEVAHSQRFYTGDTTAYLVPNTVELKTFISEVSILTVKITTKLPASGPQCLDFTEGVLYAEINK